METDQTLMATLFYTDSIPHILVALVGMLGEVFIHTSLHMPGGSNASAQVQKYFCMSISRTIEWIVPNGGVQTAGLMELNTFHFVVFKRVLVYFLL